MSDFPQIFRLRQKFARPRVADIAGEVHAQLARLELHRRVQPGQSVAITAGSRGIANIAVILRAAVEHFRSLGAEPFLVPAMGSHGGGTAEGQRQVLESYGITEACGRLPDPCEHGNHDRRPRGRRLSPAHRPRGLRGRSRAGLRPRETPYRRSPATSKAAS